MDHCVLLCYVCTQLPLLLYDIACQLLNVLIEDSPMIEVITPKCLSTSLPLLLPRAKGKRKEKGI